MNKTRIPRDSGTADRILIENREGIGDPLS